jgi:hypothetical protein
MPRPGAGSTASSAALSVSGEILTGAIMVVGLLLISATLGYEEE